MMKKSEIVKVLEKENKPIPGDAYLGEAGETPVENPVDPDYALRAAAADLIGRGPDQREIPQTEHPQIPPDTVADTMALEREKAIDAKVREMKKDGTADDVPPSADVQPLAPEPVDAGD